MEEKNLTRLLNNLNFCIYHNCAMCSRWNNHLDEDDCREELFNSVVALIHSLQSKKEEIEKLTKENELARKILSCSKRKTRIGDLIKENAELQKQVDELEKDLERLDAIQSLNEVLMLDIEQLKEKEQAVKDTAKEIYFKVKHESGVELSFLNDLALWVKERFGVAVEKWIKVDGVEVQE